jgi:hypothetical protein
MTKQMTIKDKQQLLCEITNSPAFIADLVDELSEFVKQHATVLSAHEVEELEECLLQLRLGLHYLDAASQVSDDLLFIK